MSFMAGLCIGGALEKSALLAEFSDTARLDVQLLLAHVLQKNTSYLYTWPEKHLTDDQCKRFSELLQRRIEGETIAYFLGYQDFWTLRLAVSKDTLIPRPDTELLVEQGLALLSDGDYCVADLGTGTGAVALALASERSSWKIVATDYIAAAAQLAERNRQTLQLDNVKVLTGSWFEPLVGKFDLILSNPPYIESDDHHLQQGDVRFEPLTALVAENGGLQDIQDIIEGSRAYLQDNGWLLLEHGFEQGVAVCKLFERYGYTQAHTVKDLAGNDRVSLARWLSEGGDRRESKAI